MIKIIILLIVFNLLFPKPSLGNPSASLSASPTASASSSSNGDTLEKIRDLKEKVANKVLQLKQKRKTTFLGEIKKVENDSFSLMVSGKEVSFKTTEETKYYWINSTGKRLVLSFTNLEAGDFVSVKADYDENGSEEALIVVGKVSPFFLNGTVSKVVPNEKTLILKLQGENSPFTLKLSDLTKIYRTSLSSPLVLVQFNAILPGMKIFVRGTAQKREREELTIQRVVVFGD